MLQQQIAFANQREESQNLNTPGGERVKRNLTSKSLSLSLGLTRIEEKGRAKSFNRSTVHRQLTKSECVKAQIQRAATLRQQLTPSEVYAQEGIYTRLTA
eukprot:5040052-Pleurochrysis_carterae.AAC.1